MAVSPQGMWNEREQLALATLCPCSSSLLSPPSTPWLYVCYIHFPDEGTKPHRR